MKIEINHTTNSLEEMAEYLDFISSELKKGFLVGDGWEIFNEDDNGSLLPGE